MQTSTKQPETIDVTPTWEAVLPSLLALIDNGGTARDLATGEIRRVFQHVDRIAVVVTQAEIDAEVRRTDLGPTLTAEQRKVAALLLRQRVHALVTERLSDLASKAILDAANG